MKKSKKSLLGVGFFSVLLLCADTAFANHKAPACFVSPSPLFHRNHIAAMAFSPTTRRYGYAKNQINPQMALQLATQFCGSWDCQYYRQWVQNGCIALAIGMNGWSFGVGFSMYMAAQQANLNCSQYTMGCRTNAWVCSN